MARSTFEEDADVWKLVYGIPTVAGIVLLIVGVANESENAIGFGGLLLFSVLGSKIIISFCEWISG